MKLNAKALTLMALLATGVAGAQDTATTVASTDVTAANTKIENTAQATFTDPTTGQAATPVNSNTVTTTVLPKPGFDIVYSDGTDGLMNGTVSAGNTPDTAKSTATLAPGQSLTTQYAVVNTGNTAQTITLAAQPNTVYYLASAPTTPITSVTLPLDDPNTTADEGVVNIIQVITVPAGATPGSTISATPIGTGQGFDTATNTVITSQTESTTVLGLQYATVTVYSPVLDNNSTPGGTVTNPVDPSGNPYTPTPTSTVTVPGTTTPVPGYTDPLGTPITGLGSDDQKAYPPADADTNPDVVTFTNTVTNNGTADDQVQLFPVDPATNLPLPGVTWDPNTLTFTYPDGTTVQFLDPTTGQPIPVAPGATYPTLTVGSGETAYYQTKVTYPDPNDSAPISPIVINIGADSLSDSGIVSDSNTTDTIYPPAAQFGDSTTAQGTDPTPAPNQTTQPGNTVAFPMDVANNGQYADSYTLSGTVQIPLTDGTVATVPVQYYPATAWTDTDGDGIVDSGELTGSPITTTDVVQPGTEAKLIAVVTVPTDAAATGSNTPPALQQTATGEYSTIVMTDTNDTITVQPAGSLAIAKFVQGGDGATTLNGLTAPGGYATGTSSALPGATINYAIMAKNNYNTAIQNFALNDTTPLNTVYSSATCTVIVTTGTAPACTVTTTTDANGVVTAVAARTADGTLPQGATMQLNMAVVVK